MGEEEMGVVMEGVGSGDASVRRLVRLFLGGVCVGGNQLMFECLKDDRVTLHAFAGFGENGFWELFGIDRHVDKPLPPVGHTDTDTGDGGEDESEDGKEGDGRQGVGGL